MFKIVLEVPVKSVRLKKEVNLIWIEKDWELSLF